MPRSHHTISAAAVEAAADEIAAHIAARWSRRPRVGIILGTGLGRFAQEIAAEAAFLYDELPHLPNATAIGHNGQLTCGMMGRVPVIAMEGRFHVYEGYPIWQITLPVRVMHRLDVEMLVVSNAAGAVNPNYRVGDLMLVADHINLTGINPSVDEANGSPGSRRPERSCPYDPDLIEAAARIGRRHDFACHRGVYVGLSGPCYETRAEYRYLRRIGDVVGMSTVPEAIVASHVGLPVLAISTVTNVCRPDSLSTTTGRQVLAAAAQAEPRFRAIVRGVIDDLAGE